MIQRLVLPALLLAATTPLGGTAAHAFTTLSGGKALVAKEHPVAKKDLFKVTYKDPAIGALPDPTCGGNPSTLQILTSNGPKAATELPCDGWKAAGTGYSYKQALGGAGGVRVIKSKPGILKLILQGGDYSTDPVVGPLTWVETRLTIGSEQYCGRWEEPPSLLRKNFPVTVQFKGPSTACQETCGNGVQETDEDCDDGNEVNGDGCDNNCTVTGCGNAIVTTGEQCDDGNIVSGDDCSDTCQTEICGDGIRNVGEACDDGNAVGGDCCDATCQFEPSGSACADDFDVCTDDVCDGAGACQNLPNDDPCNDLNGCTTNDTCSGGACSGEFLQPWVNEFDYDSNDGSANDDRDEFVEIAGPAGLDLSGYHVVSVEGAGGSCLTPSSISAGEAHFIATIPQGSVLADDTGTGIGFYVVCFTNTSTNVVGCDTTLPGSAVDSNLKNGHLTNADFTCPDGILLLDDQSGYVDAVGYEGTVLNTGTFGSFFHIDAPYSAERDEGLLAGVSILKNTSTLARAASTTEWTDPSELGPLLCQGQSGGSCPTNTASPGIQNAGQSMACGSPCRAFLDDSEDLFE